MNAATADGHRARCTITGGFVAGIVSGVAIIGESTSEFGRNGGARVFRVQRPLGLGSGTLVLVFLATCSGNSRSLVGWVIRADGAVAARAAAVALAPERSPLAALRLVLSSPLRAGPFPLCRLGEQLLSSCIADSTGTSGGSLRLLRAVGW